MVGLELRKTQKMAEKKFEMATTDKLLSGQLTVLVLIKHNPGETQSAIARAAGIDRSSLVPILKQFEKKGYVSRRKAERDSRSNIIEITRAGEHALSELQPVVTELETSVTDQFGANNTKQLVALLKKFQLVIKQDNV